MTEQEKKADTAAAVEADAEEPIEEESTDSEEAEAEEGDDSSAIDYQAELDKEQEKKKERVRLAQEAFETRQAKRKGKKSEDTEEEDESDEDDKPLTRREMRQMLQEQREGDRKETQEQSALAIAKGLASSDVEAALIVEKWKNYEVPGDTLQEKIEFVHAGVNRKRLLATTAEAKRALLAKDTRSKNATTTHRDPKPAGEVKLKPQDASAIKAAGMAWNGATRRYEKKIGKRTMCFDPKSGKRWFA